jgi:hypothetical protein
MVEARNAVDGTGFARTVGADDRQNFAIVRGEINVLQRFDAAEAKGYVIDMQ